MVKDPSQVDQTDVLKRIKDLRVEVKKMEDQIKPAWKNPNAGVKAAKAFITKKAELVKLLK